MLRSVAVCWLVDMAFRQAAALRYASKKISQLQAFVSKKSLDTLPL